MQPARFKPHAVECTSNPVQRPNFRGQGKGTPTDDHSRGPETQAGKDSGRDDDDDVYWH